MRAARFLVAIQWLNHISGNQCGGELADASSLAPKLSGPESR